MLRKDASPDLMARWVIINAFMYYVLDHSLMSDADYDYLSRQVTDNWDKLDPCRQWCLGTPEDTRCTGMHIRFTTIAVDCAFRLYKQETGKYPDVYLKWKVSKKYGRYVKVT